MPSTREQRLQRLVQTILLREIEDEEAGLELTSDDEEEQFMADFAAYYAIENTRYSVDRTRIPKAGNMHLLWQYAQNPAHHELFVGLHL